MGLNTSTSMMFLRAGARRLPGPVKDMIKRVLGRLDHLYFHALNKYLNNDAPNIIVLNSIKKSGTTYFRYILGNYISLLNAPDADPVSYRDIDENLFPNEKQFRLPLRYKMPAKEMKEFPYRDIYRTHMYECLKFSKARIIFMYRNPLDQIVSWFYYRYKYRPKTQNLYRSPKEIVSFALPEYIGHYNYMLALCRENPRAIAISYESLIRSPFDTTYIVLNWLDAPVNVALLKLAIERSSFENVRKEEEQMGPVAAPKKSEFTGFFTRSGKIGQWKDYFDAVDVAQISRQLADAGIDLNVFVLE